MKLWSNSGATRGVERLIPKQFLLHGGKLIPWFCRDGETAGTTNAAMAEEKSDKSGRTHVHIRAYFIGVMASKKSYFSTIVAHHPEFSIRAVLNC